jgi:hypothetical protein
VWRVVLGKLGTLQEIESHWSLMDLIDAHEILDYQAKVRKWEDDRQKVKK